MKLTKLFGPSVVALGFANMGNVVSAAEIIDDMRIAQMVANHITDNCPTTTAQAQKRENVINCISESINAEVGIAEQMKSYINEVSALTMPFQAGTAVGDLQAYCVAPANSFGGQNYKNLSNYLDAAFNIVKDCEGSFVRSGNEVGINYLPTARNTVSCHMNRMKGFDCEEVASEVPSGSILSAPTQALQF